jgi:hypothetical protein
MTHDRAEPVGVQSDAGTREAHPVIDGILRHAVIKGSLPEYRRRIHSGHDPKGTPTTGCSGRSPRQYRNLLVDRDGV